MMEMVHEKYSILLTEFIGTALTIIGDCCLCREPLSNGKTTVTIREKGAKNINEYNKLRNDSLCVYIYIFI
jgi:hypothetical protein